jgi:hypothetical protein
LLPASADADAAFDAAKEWLPANAEPDAALTLAELSYLVMRSFQIKGGAMYRIFPGPRYAYREMVYRNLVQAESDPAWKVSGYRLLHIIGRVLEYGEAQNK